MTVLLGSQNNPHTSKESMRLARDIVASCFRSSLVEYRGSLWHWERERWVERDATWVLDLVRRHFENAYVQVFQQGAPVAEELILPPWHVKAVADCINTVVRQDSLAETPIPIGRVPEFDTHRAVTFKGGHVYTVALGEVTDQGKFGPHWFDTTTVPVEYQPEASCSTWARCLQQWSGGDPSWEELVQRLFGYCLMAHRDYQRWFLFYGLPRSGKGTVLGVLRDLLGGGRSVWHTTLPGIASRFGLDGLQTARVMVINEVHEVGTLDGHAAGSVLKSVVGADPLTVDVKHVRALPNINCRAVPILQSNEIPKLPNRGAGLSSKMVIVPFGVSFLDKEDEDLSRKLRAELPGIAAWAMEGARRLSAAEPGLRWPKPTAACDAMDEYQDENSEWDRFLKDRFQPSTFGWVSCSELWRQYQQWARQEADPPRCSQRKLASKLLAESSWMLQRARRGSAGTKGMVGLRLRWGPRPALVG